MTRFGERHRGRALTTTALGDKAFLGVNPDPATALTYHLPPRLSYHAPFTINLAARQDNVQF